MIIQKGICYYAWNTAYKIAKEKIRSDLTHSQFNHILRIFYSLGMKRKFRFVWNKGNHFYTPIYDVKDFDKLIYMYKNHMRVDIARVFKNNKYSILNN